jgi:UDP-N-acetylmuramoyl-tripeptide--D-alanyl-D-alanine ligase
MGMDHPGDIKKLTEALQPDISIITNISPVHLKYMGSMDKIYRGKTDVFRYSDNSFLKLIKGDDDYSKRAKKEFANVKTYGKNENNDYSFELIDSKKNIKFEFFGENYELNLWGEFNIYNSLPAIIVAKELGIDYTQIKKGLKKVNISSNRINIIEKKGKIIINDTYNSSPSALKAVVDEMKKKYENKKKMLVLGDMLELGRYSEKYHRETVEYIEKNLHNKKCLFLGEEFNKLRNEYESQNFYFSREKLFNDLKKLLDEYDVFLFKASRGLKLEIVVNKVLGSI